MLLKPQENQHTTYIGIPLVYKADARARLGKRKFISSADQGA